MVVGGVYTSNTTNDLLNLKDSKRPFVAALRLCIKEHPILSTVIIGGDTESPELATPKTLDLNKHIELRNSSDLPEDKQIERHLEAVSDDQFSSLHTTPPWKVVLAPLNPGENSAPTRLLVLFAYYHSHGDGKSGLAFHKSFLRGLSQQSAMYFDPSSSVSFICEPPANTLLPPIEEAGKLSLSWSYLLSPLIGAYLPTSIASLLGIRATWIPQGGNVWRGRDLTFDPSNFVTGLVSLSIDPTTMRGALGCCKAQRATFTGVLTQLIVRVLSASKSEADAADIFTSQIAVNMRHLFNGAYSDDSMTNCVTGYSETIQCQPYHRSTGWATHDSDFWEAARSTSANLARAASTLHNQPIGLLQYLKEFRPWTLGQIGKERESSFEISNLGVFSPDAPPSKEEQSIKMEKVVFSQPANASGALLNFNPVSVKGGPLVMTVTWQRGVLDLAEGEDEDTFVRKVCSVLEADIRELAELAL